ncbi:hypothetical protein K8R66_05155 [bacterium]|nr:hypothetical protein [bacterium]
MYIIKKVDIKSFAKISSLVCTVFALLPWLFVGVVWFFESRFLRYMSGSYNTSRGFTRFILPLIIWFIVPFVIALLCFLLGLLFAWLYNVFIVDRVGGLKVDIVLEKDKQE